MKRLLLLCCLAGCSNVVDPPVPAPAPAPNPAIDEPIDPVALQYTTDPVNVATRATAHLITRIDRGGGRLFDVYEPTEGQLVFVQVLPIGSEPVTRYDAHDLPSVYAQIAPGRVVPAVIFETQARVDAIVRAAMPEPPETPTLALNGITCGDLATCDLHLCKYHATAEFFGGLGQYMWNTVCQEQPESVDLGRPVTSDNWWATRLFLNIYDTSDLNSQKYYWCDNGPGMPGYDNGSSSDFVYAGLGASSGGANLVYDNLYRWHVTQGYAVSIKAQANKGCIWPGCDWFNDAWLNVRVEPDTSSATTMFCGEFSDND